MGGARSTQTRLYDGPAPRVSPLEPHDDPDLRVLGVVELAEVRRTEVRLNVRRQERIERVPHPDAKPRLKPEDLHVSLDPGLETEVRRKPQNVARADEVERVVRDRVRQTAAPVGDT